MTHNDEVEIPDHGDEVHPWDQHNQPLRKPIDVERLAIVLARLLPGAFAMPASGSPREGIPYKLNALYDAGKLAAEYDHDGGADEYHRQLLAERP